MNKFKKIVLAAGLILPSVFSLGMTKSEAARAVMDKDKAKVVNVRENAGESGKIIGQIKEGEEYEITGVDGKFLEIDFKGKKAYVASYWVKEYEDTKIISPANFRKEASLDSQVIEVLDPGQTVTIKEILDNGFVKVDYKNKEGYIYINLLEIYEEILKAQEELIQAQNSGLQTSQTYYEQNSYAAANYYYSDSSSNGSNYYSNNTPSQNIGVIKGNTSGIYSFAAQFVGNSYVFGGNSLTNGTDCSGFTQSIYSNYGVDLPHNAQAQYAYGNSVNADEAKEGDLVFYGTSEGNITHVAIADGKGGIVHAANEQAGITTGSMGNPIGVKRVVEEETPASNETSEASTEEVAVEAPVSEEE
jgi:cell wall-associated NlpC family hydrolase/SH3-like domain-containing protein